MMTASSSLLARTIVLLLVAAAVTLMAAVVTAVAATETYSDEQQPLNPGDFTSTVTPNTVPALPVARTKNQSNSCRLDLSDELFGGVDDACVRGGLDRSRCCPVLAAWLFAAHARSALVVHPPAASKVLQGAGAEDRPMMPDDNQKCVDSLQSALERRQIVLPRPNSTCDTVLCYCGIRLHEIGSLRCPAAFNVTGRPGGDGGVVKGAVALNATPTAAVQQLERDCKNASYAGCTRCLQSLEKLKGHGVVGDGNSGDRVARMFSRDCQLMGLTWLLARNKTAYIPTVSAVLRAILYSAHPPVDAGGGNTSHYKCSPDQENMPLAVDSLQFQHLDESFSAARSSRFALIIFSFAMSAMLALFTL